MSLYSFTYSCMSYIFLIFFRVFKNTDLAYFLLDIFLNVSFFALLCACVHECAKGIFLNPFLFSKLLFHPTDSPPALSNSILPCYIR